MLLTNLNFKAILKLMTHLKSFKKLSQNSKDKQQFIVKNIIPKSYIGKNKLVLETRLQ